MPRGPGKKSNYNLDYSRFDSLHAAAEEDEEDEETTKTSNDASDAMQFREMLRAMPSELQEAYHMLSVGKATGDTDAQRKANELVLQAVQKGGPDVQHKFVQEFAKQMPDKAKAVANVVMNAEQPPAGLFEDTKVSDTANMNPNALTNTIDTLRRSMEQQAEQARKQLDGLTQQQEQMETLRGPEDFVKYMDQEGISEEDLRRIFGGDQDHTEKCMQGLLSKAAPGIKTDDLQDHTEKCQQGLLSKDVEMTIKAADALHESICGTQLAQENGLIQVAAHKALPGRPRDEGEKVKVPDHRLQYEKDEQGKYLGLVLNCMLQGVADMSSIDLDVSETYVRLTTRAPAPRYAVNAGPFPVLLDPSQARAKYSKRRAELTVSVVAKA